ncbi:hypothetical protein SUGI_0820370 [Cryptomeria japonica]|nr:hypothetical protein SUGI_0820370 [Cryptomeria japonica]
MFISVCSLCSTINFLKLQPFVEEDRIYICLGQGFSCMMIMREVSISLRKDVKRWSIRSHDLFLIQTLRRTMLKRHSVTSFISKIAPKKLHQHCRQFPLFQGWNILIQ